MTLPPFRIDDDYDRANADIGASSRYANYVRSRYANYVREREAQFVELWNFYDDPTVEFAATAWRFATGPIMTPGLVRFHPRVANVDVSRSDWNGELVAHITLVSDRPATLRLACAADGDYLRDWEEDSDRFYLPSEEDLARGPYLLGSVNLVWQLPPGTVSPVSTMPGMQAVIPDPRALVKTARLHVEQLVRALNRQTAPIISRLDGGIT